MRGLLACCVLMACGTPDDVVIEPDAPSVEDSPPPIVDDDGDGLDDAHELELAAAYLPYIALSPDDDCARSGLLVRVRPHPADPAKILIAYDHLFETDCGLNGHTGDNEMFGVAIDPSLPPPAGILAIKTASHQNTICERITECVNRATCTTDPRAACDLAGDYPVLYASKDKHGQYAKKSSCGLGACLDQCASNPTPHRPPIVNAGEPGAPLTTNLTTHGFITAANGWTKAEVMNFDPWGEPDFAGAGNVADDLTDATFEVAPCQ